MLFRSGITVAFFTLVSRVFGLIRELFIATIFGTGPIADCVNVAFKFPNLFRRIFGEGALSAVFVPIFSQKLLDSRAAAQKFSGEVVTLLFLVLVALTVTIQLCMPYLMALIAPGFYIDQEKYEMAVLLCRITTPYLIFISITAIFGGMLNSAGKFAAFAFSPVIMNICIILFTFCFREKFQTHFAISWALITAGILQVLFMIFSLARAKLMFSPSFNFWDRDVMRLLKNLGPAALGSGVQQINLFISQSIASFIPGAVSILSYADRLYQLPLSLVGVTFATILLPELSRIYKRNDLRQANNLQNNALILAAAVSFPAAAGLFMLANPLIHLIYERGAFLAEDTVKTANALAAFSLGLPAFVFAKILTPVFYACGDTKTPLRITAYSLAVNVVLNIILMIPFEQSGIALGSSIAGWYNAWQLFENAKRHRNFKIFAGTWQLGGKILASAAVLIAFLLIFDYFCREFYYASSFFTRLALILVNIFIAVVIYGIMLYFFKLHLIFTKKTDA